MNGVGAVWSGRDASGEPPHEIGHAQQDVTGGLTRQPRQLSGENDYHRPAWAAPWQSVPGPCRITLDGKVVAEKAAGTGSFCEYARF